jgi:hypothetical protein
MRTPVSIGRLLALAALGAMCASLTVSIQGCTVLGLMAGAAADKGGTGGPDKLMTVPVGQQLTLTLWDHTSLEGRFMGWSPDSGALPATTGISSPRGAIVRLGTREGEVDVPTEKIALVSVPSNHAIVVGLLAGLAMDVLVIRDLNRQSSRGCEGPNIDTSGFLTRSVPADTSEGAVRQEVPPAPASGPATAPTP